MSKRNLQSFGLTSESFTTVEPVASAGVLGRVLRRLLIAQLAASLSVSACVAYAYSPPKPQSYGEKVAFSLRLVTFAD